MSRPFWRSLVLITCLVTFPAQAAHAYIDPGSGSILFQLIIAGILGTLFGVKMWWRKLFGVFRHRTK